MELLKKLKLKDRMKLVLMDVPEAFLGKKIEIGTTHEISESLPEGKAEFILAFFKSQEEILNKVPRLMESVHEDTLLWVAYPKKSSRNYRSDVSRDRGWEVLGQFGFEPVSQISLDDDWSALRFRPVSRIKDFHRNEKMILSEEGKSRSLKDKSK